MNQEKQLKIIRNELQLIEDKLAFLAYLAKNKNYSDYYILQNLDSISYKLEVLIKSNLTLFPNHK